MSAGRGYAAMHEQRAKLIDEIEPVAFLAEALEQKIAQDEKVAARFLDWALRVPEPKSGTLDFDRFPFQRELYDRATDDAELVIKKSSQVGISAYLVRWAMFHADRGRTALYVFPKLQQMLDFADARIRPLILGSEYLRSRVPALHVNNKGLKQLGLGFLYARGSESVDALQSVDADVLALDEYDSLVAANIPDAERRISGSLVGLIRRVGVPTIPQYGISKLYAETDQRKWRVKCGACGEWQALTFGDNVVQGGGADHTSSDAHEAAVQTAPFIACRKCVKPLDVAKGEWVAEYPDRPVRGYHVPRLIVPGVDLKRIVAASKSREPYRKAAFYNKDLGEEYAPEDSRLSPQAIAAAQREFVMVPRGVGVKTANTVTAGIDVASVRRLNVRISEHFEENKKKALWIGEVDDFDELCNIMDRFDVNMAAIDHAPDGRLSRAFVERFAGRAYVVNYSANQRDVLMVDEQQRRASVRRVEALDATIEMVKQQRNLLPIDLPEGYVEHMQSEVRVVEENELGKVVIAYRKTGDNDYLHAEVFDMIATELWWIRQAVEQSQHQELRPLDELFEFKRSALGDPENVEYSLGPEEPDSDDWAY